MGSPEDIQFSGHSTNTPTFESVIAGPYFWWNFAGSFTGSKKTLKKLQVKIM